MYGYPYTMFVSHDLSCAVYVLVALCSYSCYKAYVYPPYYGRLNLDCVSQVCDTADLAHALTWHVHVVCYGLTTI